MTLQDHVRQILDPKQTSVLVIDMQNAYCDPNAPLQQLLGWDTNPIDEMIPRLERFLDGARSHVSVLWTRAIEDPAYAPENARIKMEAEGTPAISTPEEYTFEYYRISPKGEDKEFVKDLYDSFNNEELDSYLKNTGIRTLVFTGIYASRCVDTTLRTAFNKGYHIVVAEDLIGIPKDKEGMNQKEHEGMLSVCRSIFGYVVNSRDILNAWASYKS